LFSAWLMIAASFLPLFQILPILLRRFYNLPLVDKIWKSCLKVQFYSTVEYYIQSISIIIINILYFINIVMLFIVHTIKFQMITFVVIILVFSNTLFHRIIT
jgi:hypothetical protein